MLLGLTEKVSLELGFETWKSLSMADGKGKKKKKKQTAQLYRFRRRVTKTVSFCCNADGCVVYYN